jgi:hypothetical protein
MSPPGPRVRQDRLVSELPNERAVTQATGAKDDAWTSVNEARASWSGASAPTSRPRPIPASAIDCSAG